MARFNSLLGRDKFPVPMRRELCRKPLNLALNCEPIAALGGPDEQNSLYFPGNLGFRETSSARDLPPPAASPLRTRLPPLRRFPWRSPPGTTIIPAGTLNDTPLLN